MTCVGYCYHNVDLRNINILKAIYARVECFLHAFIIEKMILKKIVSYNILRIILFLSFQIIFTTHWHFTCSHLFIKKNNTVLIRFTFIYINCMLKFYMWHYLFTQLPETSLPCYIPTNEVWEQIHRCLYVCRVGVGLAAYNNKFFGVKFFQISYLIY